MKRKILNVIGFGLMSFASLLGLVSNIVTLINHVSVVNSVWEVWQLGIFALAFAITFGLSFFLLIVWILRIIHDHKINKE